MNEYENIILGSIITDPKLYYQHSNKFNDLMFNEPSNRIIYRAYKKLIKKGSIPMQGIDQCLEAIASAMWFAKKLKSVNILTWTHKVSLKKKQKDFYNTKIEI